MRDDCIRWRYIDVSAAYNREDLQVAGDAGFAAEPEALMAHPHRWEHITERDAEEVLMELWVARRRMQ